MHYVCEHLMVYKVAVLIWHTFQEGKCSPAYLIIINPHLSFQGFPGGSVVKKSTCQCRRLVFKSLGWEDPPEQEWQPTPGVLLGKYHGQKRLAGYCLWSHKRVRQLSNSTTTSVFQPGCPLPTMNSFLVYSRV